MLCVCVSRHDFHVHLYAYSMLRFYVTIFNTSYVLHHNTSYVHLYAYSTAQLHTTIYRTYCNTRTIKTFVRLQYCTATHYNISYILQHTHDQNDRTGPNVHLYAYSTTQAQTQTHRLQVNTDRRTERSNARQSGSREAASNNNNARNNYGSTSKLGKNVDSCCLCCFHIIITWLVSNFNYISISRNRKKIWISSYYCFWIIINSVVRLLLYD